MSILLWGCKQLKKKKHKKKWKNVISKKKPALLVMSPGKHNLNSFRLLQHNLQCMYNYFMTLFGKYFPSFKNSRALYAAPHSQDNLGPLFGKNCSQLSMILELFFFEKCTCKVIVEAWQWHLKPFFLFSGFWSNERNFPVAVLNFSSLRPQHSIHLHQKTFEDYSRWWQTSKVFKRIDTIAN